MSKDGLIDSNILLEALNSKELSDALHYNKRKVVFIICPDPFENKLQLMDIMRYGNRISIDAARRNESPFLCYSFKLGLYGFNQWAVNRGPFSEQQLFDMQVSLMLRSDYVAVYGQEYTASMDTLLNIAKLRMNRIDFRTII